MGKHSYLVDYANELLKDQSRSEKIKQTQKRKRIEEAIAVAILQNNPKRAIDLAEKYNIPPQDFGKMVAKYSQLA
jgi:predicted dehydrogenase